MTSRKIWSPCFSILVRLIQCISAIQSLGFKDQVLKSFHGQSAATLVSYCPSRSSELRETAITKHGNRLAEIRCTLILIWYILALGNSDTMISLIKTNLFLAQQIDRRLRDEEKHDEEWRVVAGKHQAQRLPLQQGP